MVRRGRGRSGPRPRRLIQTRLSRRSHRGFKCNVDTDFNLPGTAGVDYCLFEDRSPADLGDGEFGFSFQGADGLLTGVQVRPDESEPPVAVPLLLWASLVLAGLLAVAGTGLLRRRSHG